MGIEEDILEFEKYGVNLSMDNLRNKLNVFRDYFKSGSFSKEYYKSHLKKIGEVIINHPKIRGSTNVQQKICLLEDYIVPLVNHWNFAKTEPGYGIFCLDLIRYIPSDNGISFRPDRTKLLQFNTTFVHQYGTKYVTNPIAVIRENAVKVHQLPYKV